MSKIPDVARILTPALQFSWLNIRRDLRRVDDGCSKANHRNVMAGLPCSGCLYREERRSILLRRNIMRQIMIDAIGLNHAQENGDQRLGGWRVVASAWALLLLFLLLLAGVSAVACPRGGVQPDRHLAGAVIPQHDPCVGPGVPSAQGVDGCKTTPLGQNWPSYANYM
jgi:hypothetical protein